MRRLAIRNSIERIKSIAKSVGSSDLSPESIAEQAKLRIDRSKVLEE